MLEGVAIGVVGPVLLYYEWIFGWVLSEEVYIHNAREQEGVGTWHNMHQLTKSWPNMMLGAQPSLR